MDASLLASFLGDILLMFHKNLALLVLFWLFYMFIQEVWGGLYKAITFFMLPGSILHASIHYLVAKRAGMYVGPVFLIKTLRETSYSVLIPKRVRDVYYMIILMLLSAPTLSFSAFYLADLIPTFLAKLIFIWLGISFFVSGMPRTADMHMVITSILAAEPKAIFFVLWTIPLFALGVLAYDVGIAFIVSLVYFTLALLIISTFEIQEKRDEISEEVVFDEE